MIDLARVLPSNQFVKCRGFRFEELLENAKHFGALRPTVTLVVRQQSIKKFLIQEKKSYQGQRRFDLLKGGIHEDETISGALYREAHEENSITAAEILQVVPVGHIVVPFDEKNQGRDGYSMGKLHFVHFVTISDSYIPKLGIDQNVIKAFLTKDPFKYFKKNNGTHYKAVIIKAALEPDD